MKLGILILGWFAFYVFHAHAAPMQSQQEVEQHNRAAEWNQKGIDYLQEEKYDAAVYAFTQALRWKSDDQTIRKNLGVAYFQLGQAYLQAEEKNYEEAVRAFRDAADVDAKVSKYPLYVGYTFYEQGSFVQAAEAFERVVRLFPQEIDAYWLLGKIYYDQGRVLLAVKVLREGLKYDAQHQKMLELLSKAQKEQGLISSGTNHFDFHYDGNTEGDLAQYDALIGEYLESAYLQVGQHLGFPSQRVQVIFYTPEVFTASMNADTWVGGVFDGKIRVPIANFKQEKNRIREVIAHEYTHALIYQLSPYCPIWLNEGLAQLQEGASVKAAKNRLAKVREQWLSWEQLQGPFFNMEAETARIAYDLSLLLTQKLIEEFGFAQIVEYLQVLGKQQGKQAQVFRASFYIGGDEFFAEFISEH